jgi:hypothetical protein
MRFEGNELRYSAQNVISAHQNTTEWFNNYFHHIGVHRNAGALYLAGANDKVIGNRFEDVLFPIAFWVTPS